MRENWPAEARIGRARRSSLVVMSNVAGVELVESRPTRRQGADRRHVAVYILASVMRSAMNDGARSVR